MPTPDPHDFPVHGGRETGCHERGLRGPRYGRGPSSEQKGGPEGDVVRSDRYSQAGVSGGGVGRGEWRDERASFWCDAGGAQRLGDAVAGQAGGGRDRGDERLALVVAGVERARLRRASAASAPCLPSRARSAAAPTTSYTSLRPRPPERGTELVSIVREIEAPPHVKACHALPLSTDSAHLPVLDWNELRQPRSDLPRRTASADMGWAANLARPTLRAPPRRRRQPRPLSYRSKVSAHSGRVYLETTGRFESSSLRLHGVSKCETRRPP
jgi:hypothetical protein